MNDSTKPSASLFGGSVLTLVGGAWLMAAMYWTMRLEFRWKEGGVSRPVSPDTHPILFWLWIVVSLILGATIFGRGLIELQRWRQPGKHSKGQTNLGN